jgi:hypothetical protein
MAAKVIMMGTGSDYKGMLHEVRPVRDKDSVDGIDILQDLSPLIYTEYQHRKPSYDTIL